MTFPDSDWPTSVDPLEDRTDTVDIVFEDDFEWHDKRIRYFQQWLGLTGELIGAALSGKGPGGLASPIASGAANIALKLAAKAAYTAGKLLSVGDNNDTSYVEKFAIDHQGIVELRSQTSMPAAGTAGRLAYDDSLDLLVVDNGSDWLPAGGGVTALEMAIDYNYTQLASPVEETMGYGELDATNLSSTPYFRVTWNPQFTVPGTAYVRLYDIGQGGGTPIPGTPVLISTLSRTAGGIWYNEQQLSVAGAPSGNTIQNGRRMYEVTVQQSSAAGDTVFVGSSGFTLKL